MPKKVFSLLIALVLVSVVASHAWYFDSSYATGREHQCDAPLFAADIHTEHGVGHCSNATHPFDASGYEENCTDTVRTASGALWSGEWLVCGPGDGPGGSAGCDYIFVVRCGGQARSHEIQIGEGTSGYLPACGYLNGTWFCAGEDADGACSCSGTTLNCS